MANTPNSKTPLTDRGVSLPCPCCGEAEAYISLHLDAPGTFTCRNCESEFSADDIRQFIARWTKILAWVDSFPADLA